MSQCINYNGWKWIPFTTALCSREFRQYDHLLDKYMYTVTDQAEWYISHKEDDIGVEISPNQEQIDSVTCREYTQCPKESEIDIKDSRISMTCEPFPELDVTYGCKRYCLGYKL